MNPIPVSTAFDEELFGFDFLAEVPREEIAEYDTDAEGHEGVWRTIRGRRVFIRDGETLTKALERSLQSQQGEPVLTNAQLNEMEPRWSTIKDVKLRQKLSDVVEEYSNSETYEEINGALRKGDPYAWTTGPQQRAIRSLDEAFRTVGKPLSAGTTLYRVIGNLPHFKLSVGSSFEDRGFTSTTAELGFAQDIQTELKGSSLFRIRVGSVPNVIVPIGARGVKEVILPRGGSFKITGQHKDGSFEAVYAPRH